MKTSTTNAVYYYEVACEVIQKVLGVSRSQMESPMRNREFVTARRILSMLLLSRGVTTSVIGRFMNRDHSSIVHLRQTHFELIDRYPEYERMYHRCAALFEPHNLCAERDAGGPWVAIGSHAKNAEPFNKRDYRVFLYESQKKY